LSFGFVSAQSQVFLNLLVRQSSKILALNGYSIFSNALVEGQVASLSSENQVWMKFFPDEKDCAFDSVN